MVEVKGEKLDGNEGEKTAKVSDNRPQVDLGFGSGYFVWGWSNSSPLLGTVYDCEDNFVKGGLKMISEFIKEMKKKCVEGPTPTEKEISQLANHIYNNLQGGSVRRANRHTIIKLLKCIAPDLSDIDATLAGVTIESLSLAILSEFIASGTIISIKKK